MDHRDSKSEGIFSVCSSQETFFDKILKKWSPYGHHFGSKSPYPLKFLKKILNGNKNVHFVSQFQLIWSECCIITVICLLQILSKILALVTFIQ